MLVLIAAGVLLNNYYSQAATLNRYISWYNKNQGQFSPDMSQYYVWAKTDKAISQNEVKDSPVLPKSISAKHLPVGIELKKIGNTLLFFPNYKAVVSPQQLKITSRQTLNDVKINNQEISVRTLPNLFPGSYTLSAKTSDGESLQKTVYLSESRPVSVALNLLEGNLTLWVDPAQEVSYDAIAQKFEEENPDVIVHLKESPTGSANAKTDVAKDPSGAADVFEVPHDQLGVLAEGGYIDPIPKSDSSAIQSEDMVQAARAVTYKGKMYAYPTSIQSDVLFYDKSKLSTSDIKSWETLTSKAKIVTDFSNAYTVFPIFFNTGCTLFGKNGEDITGSSLANQHGIDALNWIARQKFNSNVISTDQNNTNSSSKGPLGLLQSGEAAAVLDGPWDTESIQKVLGNNFAVAAYPTVTISGKTSTMKSFVGVQTFAVNAETDYSDAANALAEYLSNEGSQIEGYKDLNLIPVNLSVQKDNVVSSDQVSQAVIDQSQKGIVMPKLSQMSAFWNYSTNLVEGTYTGAISPSMYNAKLSALESELKSGE